MPFTAAYAGPSFKCRVKDAGADDGEAFRCWCSIVIEIVIVIVIVLNSNSSNSNRSNGNSSNHSSSRHDNCLASGRPQVAFQRLATRRATRVGVNLRERSSGWAASETL